MSEEQLSQKEINGANNENKQEDNKNTSLNGQYRELERNSHLINQENDIDLKLGQYMLTPLQSILLNKKMPFGFKLETEENILKSLETTKNQAKKSKNSTRHKDKGRDNRNGGIVQNKKRNQNMNNIDNMPNNPEIYKIFKKCKKGLEKIKESKYANNYYQSNNPDIPCLANIEKKVNNYEYKNIYDFEMDVRKIWNYYFKLEQNNEITSKMSDDWEKICADLDNPSNELSVASVRKRTEQLQKEFEEIKDNNLTRESVPAPVKKNNQQNYEQNKPMTVEEKNQLGNNIRSLNKEQLKGIIRILSENNPMPKTKYFEFDIDKLSTKKLRELEKYVKECLASNNKNNKNITSNNNNNNTHIQNSNSKIQNQKENQNNKSNNKGANAHIQNQPVLKSNSKDMNKNQENKVEQSVKKIKSNKKMEKKNDLSSDSDSISSGSSLSN